MTPQDLPNEPQGPLFGLLASTCCPSEPLLAPLSLEVLKNGPPDSPQASKMTPEASKMTPQTLKIIQKREEFLGFRENRDF